MDPLLLAQNISVGLSPAMLVPTAGGNGSPSKLLHRNGYTNQFDKPETCLNGI